MAPGRPATRDVSFRDGEAASFLFARGGPSGRTERRLSHQARTDGRTQNVAARGGFTFSLFSCRRYILLTSFCFCIFY
jgi:hypothetical protein